MRATSVRSCSTWRLVDSREDCSWAAADSADPSCCCRADLRGGAKGARVGDQRTGWHGAGIHTYTNADGSSRCACRAAAGPSRTKCQAAAAHAQPEASGKGGWADARLASRRAWAAEPPTWPRRLPGGPPQWQTPCPGRATGRQAEGMDIRCVPAVMHARAGTQATPPPQGIQQHKWH